MSKEEEFDGNERVLGFSLVGIKRAPRLGRHHGRPRRREERLASAQVSRAPGHPRAGGTRAPWPCDEGGEASAVEDDAAGASPRVLLAASASVQSGIERATSRCGEGLQSVRCGIRRGTEDGADMFEEAEIDPTLSVQYEGGRLVEVNVTQPHDYDEAEAGGATIAMSSSSVLPRREAALPLLSRQ
jgi:hypothetical protein